MNQKDKQVLKILQTNFLLDKNPFKVLSRRLFMSEDEIIAKIMEFKKNGFIRRIGAVLNGEKLKYHSVLIAIKVDAEDVDKIANFINGYDNVSHNYLRDCQYNIWCTFSAASKREINDFTKSLRAFSQVRDVLALGAKKMLKINARFDF